MQNVNITYEEVKELLLIAKNNNLPINFIDEPEPPLGIFFNSKPEITIYNNMGLFLIYQEVRTKLLQKGINVNKKVFNNLKYFVENET